MFISKKNDDRVKTWMEMNCEIGSQKNTEKLRAIAFYLPQFYPTPENDDWWEPGFTEWTNVVKTKPLFRGHYQPKLPRDLGFYDLRVPETREKQAILASEAGIEGFCYWHYWFGKGKRLLDRVFREVVETGKPDYPFCLCWANHSWYAKTWDPNTPDKLLMEQTYPGIDDYIDHFYAMLSGFQDKRYIKVDGRLLFGIFEPISFDDFSTFRDTWNKLAKENGLEGFYFVGLCQGAFRLHQIKTELYDAVSIDCILDTVIEHECSKIGRLDLFLRNHFNKPVVTPYDRYMKIALKHFRNNPDRIPCIEPNFDHTPRSNDRGTILHNSTPQKWGEMICKVKEQILCHNNKRLLFIKAWNEWGEGNYLEPDRKWGKGYIEEMSKYI